MILTRIALIVGIIADIVCIIAAINELMSSNDD